MYLVVNINSINQISGKISLLFTYARGKGLDEPVSSEHLLLRQNVGTHIKAQAKI